MTNISLFSGVAGIDLAAHWAGFQTIQFVEQNEFCQRVLAKHFPGVPIHDDIRTFGLDSLDELGLCYNEGAVSTTPLNPKYDGCLALYSELKSVGKCAERYGISRQAMWKILARRGCAFEDQTRFESDNHFYLGGDPKKDKAASHKVEKALRSGRLIRSANCERCGEPDKPAKNGRSGLAGHHEDYSKPLEVVWLCQRCHVERHKEIYSQEVSQKGSARRLTLLSGGPP